MQTAMGLARENVHQLQSCPDQAACNHIRKRAVEFESQFVVLKALRPLALRPRCQGPRFLPSLALRPLPGVVPPAPTN